MENKYNFEFLNNLLDRGIVTKKHSLESIPEAIHDGIYMGCPGKEIFHGLGFLSEEEINILVQKVCEKFPFIPPGRSVHLSVFLRYIYGCFDKQGILYNNDQKQEIIAASRDWSKSHNFAEKMCEQFDKLGNSYGHMMTLEMMAHRIGDAVEITGDQSLIDKMVKIYEKAGQMAVKIGDNKNTFSSYYWCFKYLVHFKQPKDRCIRYAVMFFDNVEQFCKSSTVKGKLASSLNLIRSILTKREWKRFIKRFVFYKNKVLNMNLVKCPHYKDIIKIREKRE